MMKRLLIGFLLAVAAVAATITVTTTAPQERDGAWDLQIRSLTALHSSVTMLTNEFALRSGQAITVFTSAAAITNTITTSSNVYHTLHVTTVGATNGATIKFYRSVDGTYFVPFATNAAPEVAAGSSSTAEIQLTGAWSSIKAWLDWTNGTHTVKYFGK